ncbi:MAG: restriction endonuclease subunit S [Proteobacteria bacterium]|nr:restriction endonuclease subunit S [Pseudomonadota bacterium]
MTLKRGHDLPEHARQEGEVPVVSSSGITGFHNEAKAKAPGVVTGRYGTLGEVFYVAEDYWPLNTALYVVDFKGNDPQFSAYLLKNALKDYQSDKAAVPGVDRNVLHEIEVIAPDLATQYRVRNLLAAYDDLIENNRRRMGLLEESARLLYHEWFVHLRFPGHEHTRIVDGVPKGWERVPTPDAIEINPRTRLSDDEEHWYVEMAALLTDSMVIDGAVMRDGRSGSKFRNGDTLFARITPCLENGKTGFVNFMAPGESGRGSTEFIVLRSNRVTPEFVYCLARTYDFREHAIKSMVGSSGRQRVQESCFDKYMVLVPPSDLLRLFSESSVPIFDQIKNLHAQNRKLRAARDLLLPRLMSGEITV